MVVIPWLPTLLILGSALWNVGAGSFSENKVLPQTPSDAEAIIARHLEAVGGEDRLRAIISMVLDCRVGNVSGNPRRLTRYFRSPNFYRLEVEGSSGATVTDGHRVWEVSEEGWVEYSRPNTTIDMNMQNMFYDLLFYEEKGIVYEHVGAEVLAGSSVHKVKKTHRDGSTHDLYFSETTGLLTLERSEFAGELHQVSYFNYRDVGGMRMPFYLVVSYDHLYPLHVLWLEAVNLNVYLDTALFTPPEG